MTIRYKSHGRTTDDATQTSVVDLSAPPAAGDVTTDEQADFGYFFPPSGNADDYLDESQQTISDLDALGNAMIDLTKVDDVQATPDSGMPAVFTYWGQFLDHELTAQTDRESAITQIKEPLPMLTSDQIEANLKNARSPRFDLDSVYGGIPIGPDLTKDVATVIAGMRHPTLNNKMRVGTAHDVGPLPDGLDPHRDLPRYGQVEEEVRSASLRLAEAAMSAEDFTKFQAGLNGRALIGDMRNDENLIIAQFHLSVLRFHNKVVDFLENTDTGWPADFHSAQTLTRLHYQWLVVHQYLQTICINSVVDALIDNRAAQFFNFRSEYFQRNAANSKGNALPLEFSVAMYRFGHTMVRNIYDYNKNFGRPGDGLLPNAPFKELFNFTGAGGFQGLPKVPENWVIDWTRFVGIDPHDGSDGQPTRNARALDTQLAPPLGDMTTAGNEHPEGSELRLLFKHLARSNLRRGLNLRLPTGQALHEHLKSIGVVQSDSIDDVGDLFTGRPEMQQLLRGSPSRLHEKTPLWFYCLAEAEAGGGEKLGEVGSWIVASTFIGVMYSDPDSALSRRFNPEDSPLRLENGEPIDSIEKWMRFALVME